MILGFLPSFPYLCCICTSVLLRHISHSVIANLCNQLLQTKLNVLFLGFRKKKKKDKERDLAKAIENTKMGEEASSSSSSSVQIDKRTPAELAFQRAQEKRV